MCTHTRYITNRYTGDKVLVSCGKCPACLEAKALNRTNRIKNTYDGSNIALFVTLTYKNEFIPYIRKSDIDTSDGHQFLPIYRDATCRRVRVSDDYRMRFKTIYNTSVINEIYVDYPSDFEKSSLKSIVHGHTDKVSVPYFKDLQDFEKRLRIILQRKGYSDSFQYFQCLELGPTTHRAHAHLLLFIRPMHEALFRTAIVQAWPFADSWRTARNIEVAKNAASYVSKYVNRDSSISDFFGQHCLRPKHSYSQGFGMGRFAFTFSEFEKAVDKGDVSYYVERKIRGVRGTVNLPIPKYVVNRWFPLFKGYSRIDSDKIFDVVSGLVRYCQGETAKHPLTSFPLDYSTDDLKLLPVKLKNAYNRLKTFGYDGTSYDFARLYCRAWTAWKSTVLRLSFDDVVTAEDNFLHYDNLVNYVSPELVPPSGRVRSLSLDALRNSLPPNYQFVINPNLLPSRMFKSSRLEDIYRKSVKKRKVTNYAMSEIYGDV